MKGKNQKIFLNVVAILILAVFLFPLYWIVITSLKSEKEIFAIVPTLFPKEIQFNAYIDQVLGEYNLVRGFFNSCILGFSTMIISVLLAIPAAWGLARYQVRGRKFLIQSFLLTQMLPATLMLTPMFIIYKKIGILDTYWAPIIACCTGSIPFIVMMLRTYFITIPKEVEEAALIDGCNTLKAFIRIILPMSKPGVIMACIFSFIGGWGELMYSLTFISDDSMRPMMSGIYNFMGRFGMQWNKIMAFGTVTILPIVLIFIFMQKYIVAGLTSGAVKD